jgi:homoserine O-acetyltransferase
MTLIHAASICLLVLIFSPCLFADINQLNKQEGDFIIDHYTFKNGQTLDNLKIHYTTLGTPQKDAQGNITNAILMLHQTSSNGEALVTPEFITTLYDPGKPLDASKYFLIFPDNIGTGKSSKPSDGLHMNFPNYRYLDMVDLQHRLVTEKLGIKRLKYIIGISMGGMHTWLWSELYPEAMEGAMPIVSLPVKIQGRNLVWRQASINSLKKDPQWNNGDYTHQPNSLKSTWALIYMLLSGVPHLQKTITDVSAAQQFIQEAEHESENKDANDLIYVLDASTDYNPEPDLDKITTPLFALNFSDDELNPAYLHILEDNIKKVKHGKAITQKGTVYSLGHATGSHPEFWSTRVTEFIDFVNSK